MKIRHKIALVTSIVSTVIMAVFAWYVIVEINKTEYEKAEEVAKSSARQHAQEIGNITNHLIDLLMISEEYSKALIAANILELETTEEETTEEETTEEETTEEETIEEETTVEDSPLSKIVIAILENNPYVFGMWVELEDVVYFHKQNNNIVMGEKDKNPGFLNLQKTTMIGPKMLDINGTQKKILTIVTPIKDNDINRGNISIEIDFDRVQEYVSGITLYDTGFARIVDNDGYVLAHKSPDRIGDLVGELKEGSDTESNEMYSNAFAQGLEYADINFSVAAGINTYKFVTPIHYIEDIKPWSFGTMIILDEMYAEAEQKKKTIIVVAVGAILLLTLLIYIVITMLTKPIQNISALAKEKAEGNLQTRISQANLERSDEIGDLYRSFQLIDHSINELVNDIQAGSVAAFKGRLLDRADTTKHQGEYRNIMEGQNQIMDAMVAHLDNVPNPVIILNTNMEIQFANVATASLVAKTQRELLGKHCHSLFHCIDCHTPDCACDQAMQSGISVTRQAQATPMPDTTLDIRYTGNPLYDQQGNVIGVTEIIIDETDIMQARRQAQKVAEQVTQTTEELQQAAELLLEVAEILETESQTMNDKASSSSASVEQISASSDENAHTAKQINSYLATVASSVEETAVTVISMSQAAAESSTAVRNISTKIIEAGHGASRVSISTTEVSRAVQDVASAIKEINLSLGEVSHNCERSQLVVEDANQQAKDTSKLIEQLSQSSAQIGKIVNVISDIADQTNMLALNAAIEAAGAGAAGKGFAVVANEVKELAKQTGEATEQIAKQIETMQKDMGGAVQSVTHITDVIREITEITNTIASAVTQQTATVGEITKSVLEAAEKTSNIEQEIDGLAEQFSLVSISAKEMESSVDEVARSSSEIARAAEESALYTEQAFARMEEMTKSTEEVSCGTQEISKNVEDIALSAQATNKGARRTSAEATNLKEISDKLSQLMKEFRL